MKAVRQVKIMVKVKKTLSSSLNLKNLSILCPLITSAFLYVVKTLHGHIPYHCIVHKIQGLCFNKVNHFHCKCPKIISNCQAFLWQQEPISACCSVPKSLSVDAAVYPSGVGSNCLHTCYHSTMSPCHGFCAISPDTDTNTS